MDQEEPDRFQPPTIDQICTMVDGSWQSLSERGIGPDRQSIISAAAVGLVEKVWRNSPVENAHASKRGPHDGEMMAESVHLYSVAHAELSRENTCSGLFTFERYVLGLDRPWHGTTRTVKDMLYGHLGEFRKHVKVQTNTLTWLADEGSGDTLLGFLCLFTHYYGSNHFGMPNWPKLVDASIDHLSRPADSCWRGRHDVATQRLRSRFDDPWVKLGESLHGQPGLVDPNVLDALIGSGALMFGEVSVLGHCEG